MLSETLYCTSTCLYRKCIRNPSPTTFWHRSHILSRLESQITAVSSVPCSWIYFVFDLFIFLGVWFDCHQDLHSHGHTGNLSNSVGHGPCRCLQGQQVGNAVQHTADEEDEEVKPCHPERRSGHGIDGAQEEKREDVLHVVNMSSEMKDSSQHAKADTQLFSTVVWLSYLWCSKVTTSHEWLWFGVMISWKCIFRMTKRICI